MKAAFTNLITPATLAASTEDASYPKANAKTPQRPFLPWRTTVTTDSYLVIDFGAPTTVLLAGLASVNYASARIQGNGADAWGAPAHNDLLTIARCPWNWRYQHTHLLAGFTYRYMRFFIPNQTPVDGAAYFSTGGLFIAGTLATPPAPWRWGSRFQTVRPHVDVRPEHGGWLARSKRGEPITRIEADVLASVTGTTPAKDDELDTWQDLLRQAWDADVFWLSMDLGDPAQGWMMRVVDDPVWNVEATASQSPWVLEEVVTA